MTTAQLQLPIPRPAGQKPAVDAAEVDRLIVWLAGKGWVQRREIERLTAGTENSAWDERRLRALAEASEGHIISGQRGYRLTCEADPQERDEFIARMRGQRNAATRRIKQTWSVHLRGLRPRCLR